MDTQEQRDRLMFLQGRAAEAAETLKKMQKEWDESQAKVNKDKYIVEKGISATDLEKIKEDS